MYNLTTHKTIELMQKAQVANLFMKRLIKQKDGHMHTVAQSTVEQQHCSIIKMVNLFKENKKNIKKSIDK